MPRENSELVRQVFELFDRRAAALTADLFDPDVEFARVGEEFADLVGEWRGRDQMWNAIMQFLGSWEDMRHEFDQLIDLGDRVLALVRQIARGRTSGALVERELAFLFTVRDNRIVRWEVYWNRCEALAAAGLRG